MSWSMDSGQPASKRIFSTIMVVRKFSYWTQCQISAQVLLESCNMHECLEADAHYWKQLFCCRSPLCGRAAGPWTALPSDLLLCVAGSRRRPPGPVVWAAQHLHRWRQHQHHPHQHQAATAAAAAVATASTKVTVVIITRAPDGEKFSGKAWNVMAGDWIRFLAALLEHMHALFLGNGIGH